MFIKTLQDLYLNYYKAKRIITKFKPKLILTNGDRHVGLEQAVLKIAKQQNIKGIVPYLVYLGIESCIRLRQKQDLVGTISSQLLTNIVMKILPKQVINYENKKYLFYSASITLVYRLFGTLSEHLWYIGNGLADIVCLNNFHTYQRYESNMVAKEKLKIIGDVIYNDLRLNYLNRKEIRERIIKKYDLDKSKKIILITLSQLAEHNLLSWDKYWQEINYLMTSLKKQKQNILVSLHPKMKKEKYKFLEEKYKCRVVEERLYEILPVADLFVATFSSTVFWSVLCKINTIVVDFYNLNYSMFNILETVRIVKYKNELELALKKYLNIKLNFEQDWKSLSRNEVFDGNTIKQYKQLFKEYQN